MPVNCTPCCLSPRVEKKFAACQLYLLAWRISWQQHLEDCWDFGSRRIPEGSRRIPEGFRRTPEGFRRIPEGFRKIPKDSRESRRTPEGSQSIPKDSKDSEGFQGFPKDQKLKYSQESRRFLQDSEGFPKDPRRIPTSTRCRCSGRRSVVCQSSCPGNVFHRFSVPVKCTSVWILRVEISWVTRARKTAAVKRNSK